MFRLQRIPSAIKEVTAERFNSLTGELEKIFESLTRGQGAKVIGQTIGSAGGSSGLQRFSKTATWVNGQSAIVSATAPIIAVHIPVNCTIKQVNVLTKGGPSSCTIEIKKTSIGAYGVGTSITGGSGFTLSATETYNDTTLSGWTTSLAADDVLLFSLPSSVFFTYIHVSVVLG